MNALLTVVGWVDLAASTTLAGGLVSGLVVAPLGDAGRRVLRRAALVLAAALAAEFALTAVRMHELSEIGGWPLLADLAGTRWGRLWLGRVLGAVVLALAARASRPSTGVAIVALAWLLLRSFQGHAGAHGTVPALIDWLHLAAASVWIGGLVQLRVRGEPVDPALALRFRRVATVALALLLPAGVYGAFLHVPTVGKLATTPYGRTLVTKLVVALGLVALGAANHFRHVPALAAGALAAGRRLVRTVGVELALAAVVLLLSALLGVLPMPHGLP